MKKSKLSLSQLYVGFGGGFDFVGKNGSALAFGTSFTLSNHWGVSIGYHNTRFNSHLPADYKPGYASWGDYPPPHDRIQYWSYCVAREMFVNRNGTVRLGLEAGPSTVIWDYNSFTPDPTYTGFRNVGFFGWTVDPNYTYQEYRTTGYGLALKARAQVVSRFVGIEIAMYGNINTLRSTYGIDANLMLGYLRNKIPPERRQIIKAMSE